MEETKSRITTRFKILKCSEWDSTKILARSKDSEVQRNVSYIIKRLDAIQDIQYEEKVEDEIVDEWVSIPFMARYEEFVDRLEGCLEDLCEKKKAELRKIGHEMQEQIFQRGMEEELKIEEMNLEMKKENEDDDMMVSRNIQVNLPKLV